MSREGELNEARGIRTLSDQLKKYKQYFAINIDFQIIETNLRLLEIDFQNIATLFESIYIYFFFFFLSGSRQLHGLCLSFHVLLRKNDQFFVG